MSFAEQLAARAAKKRTSVGSAASSDGGSPGGGAPSLADGIQRRAAEKSSSTTTAGSAPSKSKPKADEKKQQLPKAAPPINSGDEADAGRMSFGTAIKHKSSQNPTAGFAEPARPVKPKAAERTKRSPKEAPPKNNNAGDDAGRMSFGTAIKAKSSRNIADGDGKDGAAKPVAKYREPTTARQSSFNDSLLSMSSVEGENKRGSFNTSINSLSASIKQRRAGDVEKEEGKSSGTGRSPGVRGGDMNDLVDEGESDEEGGGDGRRGLHVPDWRRDQPQSSPTRQTATLNGVADKYKSENKKLRKESLMLKARLEELDRQKASAAGYSQKRDGKSDRDAAKGAAKGEGTKANALEEENARLRGSMIDLQKQFKELEIKLWRKNKVEEENEALRRRMGGLSKDKIGDNIDWSDRSSGVALLQDSQRSGGGILKKKGGREGPLGLDQSGRSEMSRDELMAENVRLSQMLLEIGELEELEKLRTCDMGEEDKNAAIMHLRQKQKETERELAEMTELKNAEIAVLRKQLDRAEHLRTGRDKALQKAEEGKKEKSWNEEREGLRAEIRRLNQEVSSLREKCQHRESFQDEAQEDAKLTRRYAPTSNGGPTGDLDGTDVSSLQSIIGMMRQTIDQSNKEKELLEQRLAEEQERSQMELRAFAKTLEGVDDLRTSAEAMSREIRRIKVKGYRPTRSDLLGGAGSLEGVRNFGELTAAVEASESMEDAIRIIESQNDAMEERRRMGVVASQAAASEMPPRKKEGRYRSGGLGPIPDDGEGGGFLSFWNGEGRDDAKTKDEGRKKKAKRKSKKRGDGDGSVLTSFF